MKVFVLALMVFVVYHRSWGQVADPEASQVAPLSDVDNSGPEKIGLLSVVTELPTTGWESLKMGFSRKSIPYWGLIITSTALLYKYDEDIYEDVKMKGRKWGLGNEDQTRELVKIGPWPLRTPADTGAALYFLGDGITHFAIAGSLIGYGYFSDNHRPYNTGLQLVHGMAISTFFSQIIKRSTGRESPFVKTEERGAWRPFPSISEYGSNTPKYDAMPSGHIMTATVTFTVLIENYPEHEYWLRPLEVTWLSLLGFQMVNNGVHWASDYPLGIAMGYVCGKTAARLGKKKLSGEKDAQKYSWSVMPMYEQGIMMTKLLVSF
ncbi:MAG: phosphatase PAP2 family protein [Bdellovibrionales bacterium]|nr:phosphatase PAP2 family protein [Bdellovibrionales bacterium]